ncbi:MAG: chorismate mutase [Eubacteriales bacterium]|nr:chorismate mutase [Eubacteriales bacterium]
MNLQDYRSRMDEIDGKLTKLFLERMSLSAEIAAFKAKSNMPFHDPERERAIITGVADISGPKMSSYTNALYSLILELSRRYQIDTQEHNQIFGSPANPTSSSPSVGI